MTTHRELCAFSIPRCEAVPVPGAAGIVRHPPPGDFPLRGLRPSAALAADLGNVWPLEYEPALPYRERSRGLPIGRVAAYRDGLLFLPNTNLAVLADVGQELKQVVSFMSADFDMKAHFLSGADKDIVEALGGALEHLEELLSNGHDGGSDMHTQAHEDKRDLPPTVRASLAKTGAIVLPYALLVKVAVIEAAPETLWQRMTFPKRKLLYLLRETTDGARSAYGFNLEPDEHKNAPFAYYADALPPHRRLPPGTYASGALSWTEALAATLVSARATSDIGALWLAAERERLNETAMQAIRAKASEIDSAAERALFVAGAVGEERRRSGTTDSTIARGVLDRLGDVAAAFSAVPFARHGLPDPIAALKATASS